MLLNVLGITMATCLFIVLVFEYMHRIIVCLGDMVFNAINCYGNIIAFTNLTASGYLTGGSMSGITFQIWKFSIFQ